MKQMHKCHSTLKTVIYFDHPNYIVEPMAVSTADVFSLKNPNMVITRSVLLEMCDDHLGN